jgi:outer membrane protein assembly factor BamB
MKRNIFIALLTITVAFLSCKKTPPPRSSEKGITFFQFQKANNPGLPADVTGYLNGDSIIVPIPDSIAINNLVPTITFTGKTINPLNGVAQNFTTPVTYTVTADDGSMITYIVVVKHLSDAKSITSFIFKAVDNAGFGTDVTGNIYNDTIVALIPANVALSALIPTVSFIGASLFPSSNSAQDFTNVTIYTVVAEDGTVKKYTVILSQNAVIYAGSTDNNLYAIDAATGNVKWTYTTGGSVTACPSVSNGIIYFGSSDGYLYAVDTTGNLKWKYAIGGGTTSYASLSPSVSNGIVYVGGGNYLSAVNAETGTLVWNKNISWGFSEPTVANGIVYVNGFSLGTAAYDAATGALIWSYGIGTIRVCNPAVVNGVFYSGDEAYKAFALDAATGTHLIWGYTDGGQGSPASPTLANGNVYIASYTGGLFAFDSLTGTLKWQVGPDGNGTYGSPTCGNGLLYVNYGQSNGVSGGLLAVDALTGAQKWYFTFGPNYALPVQTVTFANNVVYASCDNYLFALDSKTGNIKWKCNTNGSVVYGPCVVDSRAVVHHSSNSGEQN